MKLLTKSDNPNIRIGAVLALGIACAGKGMVDAISIIKPLLNDSEVFVMQNAMYSMAMILQTQKIPYTEQFKDFLNLFIKNDVDENMAVGMKIAYGILNASSVFVVSCNSLRGENCALSTAALALFCNYFSRKLLYLMLPLSFHTTAVFGLDKNLNVAGWKIMCKINKDDDDLKILKNPFKVEMNLAFIFIFFLFKKFRCHVSHCSNSLQL